MSSTNRMLFVFVMIVASLIISTIVSSVFSVSAGHLLEDSSLEMEFLGSRHTFAVRMQVLAKELIREDPGMTYSREHVRALLEAEANEVRHRLSMIVSN